MKLTLEEVNRIIAEYMGEELYEWTNGDLSIIGEYAHLPIYTVSLDALIPPIAKRDVHICILMFLDGVWHCCLRENAATSKNYVGIGTEAAEAAANAFALSLKEVE